MKLHTLVPSVASLDGLVDANEVCRLIDLMLARHIGHVSNCFAQTSQKPLCKHGCKYKIDK